MRFSQTYAVAHNGLSADIIGIETDVTRGLYNFSIVGLGDKVVEESRERICAAIRNSGFDSPKTKNHKITVSLSPAYLRKEGSSFDVAIAISYLNAINVIKRDTSSIICIGELSLNGEIRAARGILNTLKYIQESEQLKHCEIFIPKNNIHEALLIVGNSTSVFLVTSLLQLTRHLQGIEKLDKLNPGKYLLTHEHAQKQKQETKNIDFKDIIGQETAKRAAIIAVAGRHNMLLIGPPGSGKTLIAKTCQSIMPALSKEEAIEVTAIHSLISDYKTSITNPPFRSPHHTSSYASITGGGSHMLPGEISLAHNGILFLDELPEFDRRVIESLRQPMEEKIIDIARAKQHCTFPARTMIVAALNPCPCGFYGSNYQKCICTPIETLRYRKKISGPILDRMEVMVAVDKVKGYSLGDNSYNSDQRSKSKEKSGEKGGYIINSEEVRKIIIGARTIQYNRCVKNKIKPTILNSEILSNRLEEIVRLSARAKEILNQNSERLEVSMRGYHSIVRVARTIADLDKSETVEERHILEALSFRPKKVL